MLKYNTCRAWPTCCCANHHLKRETDSSYEKERAGRALIRDVAEGPTEQLRDPGDRVP